MVSIFKPFFFCLNIKTIYPRDGGTSKSLRRVIVFSIFIFGWNLKFSNKIKMKVLRIISFVKFVELFYDLFSNISKKDMLSV